MITAVDTNILLDVLLADPDHGPTSRDALRQARQEGAIVACDAVWAELCSAFAAQLPVLKTQIAKLDLSYDALQQDAAERAAECWHRYRSAGGNRSRIAADFLIGGHALVQADRLLTRDAGFYRGHFAELRVLAAA